MNKSNHKIIFALLCIVLVLAGCTQPELEDLKTLEKKNVSAVINLPGGTNTRTILPGELDHAATYTITLTPRPENVNKETVTRPSLTANPQNQIELVDIPVGLYDVHVDGYNALPEPQIILKGDSTKEDPLNVTTDNVAEMDIKLIPQYGKNLKGSIEVTFDWSALVGMKADEQPSANANGIPAKTKGPISTAIEDGYMEFSIWTADLLGDLVEKENTVIWEAAPAAPAAAGTPVPENAIETEKTCRFDNIETGKDLFVAFSIKNRAGDVLVDKKFGITAQVYADQVSYYNGNSNYKIHLIPTMDKWYRNVSNVAVSYPEVNSDTSLIVSWDDIRKVGNMPVFKSVELGIGTIVEGKLQDISQTFTFTPDTIKENKHAFENLDKTAQYYITTRTVSKGDKPSNTIIWKKNSTEGFKTKVEVTDWVFDTVLPESKVFNEAFDFRAHVNPADATFKLVSYSVEDQVLSNYKDMVTDRASILVIDNPMTVEDSASIRANRPGIAKIVASNNDPHTKSTKTESSIKVVLGQTMNVSAVATQDTDSHKRGITLTWDPVPFAEEYVIYRSVDSGKYEAYKTPTTETSFVDESILTGKTYSYKVEATAPELDSYYGPDFHSTGAQSVATAGILIKNPTITLTPISIQDQTFNLQETLENGSKESIYERYNESKDSVEICISLQPGEKKTIGLAAPIEGFNQYIWKVDTTTILNGTFEETNNIVIDENLAGLDAGEEGSHTVTFIALNSETRETYSANFEITLTLRPVASITSGVYKVINDTPEPTEETRFSTKAQAKIAINGQVFDAYNGVPSNETVNYSVVTPDVTGMVAIDKFSGVITATRAGVYTFAAFSPENPQVRQEFTLTFYEPTVGSTENLVKEVNTVLSGILKAADQHYKGDWWDANSNPVYKQPTVGAWKNSSTIYIQRATGGIELYGYTSDLGTIGTGAKLSTKSTDNPKIETDGKLLVWAVDGDYYDTDPLQFIGYTGDSKHQAKNTIEIELPNLQGKAFIQYCDVNIRDNSNLGHYNVWFEKEIELESGKVLSWTKNNPDVVTATVSNRPTVK